ALSVPIQAAAVPPADPDEEPQWGFDEAQIETARRASVPVAGIGAAPVAASAATSTPLQREKKGGRRYGLVLALMTICILAGAGYFGFIWWQGQQESESETVVARRPARRPQPGAAPLATTPPANVATATSTAPAPAGVVIAPPVTGTASASLPTVITPAPAAVPTTTTPATAPIQITAAAPAATTTAASDALPRVTARVPAGRERIDAMAREYATNPAGNFTVQIQILCDPSNLEKAMRAGGGRVWFVPQTIGARSCYRVFWGRFDTRAAAQQAMSDVPAALRDPNAAVKAVPRR
ncbi:MAG TPA: SPOR domain-containing protein, partial [Thermoanaerobaculia bacterium]|nr:SPOR domain-containing protein [Thermoanaerobaculia bacterium]